MTIRILQHVPFETPGNIIRWAGEKGHKICLNRLWEMEEIPEERSDALIIMGGPMNIYEEDLYPWLYREKQVISGAIDHGIPVLGICLGAQLIADCLGSRIYMGSREIGWYPVMKTAPQDHYGFLPEIATVFHWHGETFDLPEGAMPLYSSDATPNQAFTWKRKVLALQFHLEMNKNVINGLLSACPDDLSKPGLIMSPEEICKGIETYEYGNYRFLSSLLNYFLEGTRHKG